jgi:hypothetical protein
VEDGEMNNLHARLDRPNVSGLESSLFLVGKDRHGNWVVRDESGLCGGLFVGRAEALKFAMSENGNRPQAVVMVAGVLELDMSATPRAGQRSTTAHSNAKGLPTPKRSGHRSRRKSATL